LPKPFGNQSARSESQAQQPAIKALIADGPAPKLKDKLMLFGQFVGDWRIQTQLFNFKGNVTHQADGYVHFGWILYGTAIQDVWTGTSDNPKVFGTTVRFYDPRIDAWQCTRIDPPNQIVQRLVARRVTDTIVLETTTVKGGYPERRIFSEITPQSFHWHSEESHDGGKTWILTEDIHAQRGGSGKLIIIQSVPVRFSSILVDPKRCLNKSRELGISQVLSSLYAVSTVSDCGDNFVLMIPRQLRNTRACHRFAGVLRFFCS
jgi:hypothetical protein